MEKRHQLPKLFRETEKYRLAVDLIKGVDHKKKKEEHDEKTGK